MSEQVRFGDPKWVERETSEPQWPAFDRALSMVSNPERRAILRVLYGQTKHLGFADVKRQVQEYRVNGRISPSSLSGFLKELAQYGLVIRDNSDNYRISLTGSHFLAAYDTVRQVLSSDFEEAMKAKAEEMFLPITDKQS